MNTLNFLRHSFSLKKTHIYSGTPCPVDNVDGNSLGCFDCNNEVMCNEGDYVAQPQYVNVPCLFGDFCINGGCQPAFSCPTAG